MINISDLTKLDETLTDIKICKEISEAFSYILTKNNFENIDSFVTLDFSCIPIVSLMSEKVDFKYLIPIYPTLYSYNEYKLKWEHYKCLNEKSTRIVLVESTINDFKEIDRKIKVLDYFKRKISFEILCLLCIKSNANGNFKVPVLSLIER